MLKVSKRFVVGFEPVLTTTPMPTTTTAKPNVTTKASVEESLNITLTTLKSQAENSTIKPTPNAITPDGKSRKKRDAQESSGSEIKVNKDGKLVPYNGSFPFVCVNNSMVPLDKNKVYGYFSKDYTVKGLFNILSTLHNFYIRYTQFFCSFCMHVFCQASFDLFPIFYLFIVCYTKMLFQLPSQTYQ